jgi:hypothetical protein
LSVPALGFALFLAPSSIHAQADAGASRVGVFQAGGTINFDHPGTNPTVVGHGQISGKYDIGGAFYSTFDLTEHFGATFEFNLPTTITPDDYLEKSYLIGARYTHRVRRYEPYGKVLFGLGHTSYDYPVPWIVYPSGTGSSAVIAFGGGLDYRIKDHINIRAFDYEFQIWPGLNPSVKPQIISVGAAYRFR